MTDDGFEDGGGGRGRGRGRGGRGGRGGGHHRGGGRGGGSFAPPPSTPAPDLASLTPLQRHFTSYSHSLDAHNDKRERIYQIARDLIKAAKRVIFTLQRPLNTPASPASTDITGPLIPPHLAQQAELGLQDVYQCFGMMHEELARDTDALDGAPASSTTSVLESSYYRYSQQYSFAVQEYVEAVSFFHFLTTRQLIPLPYVEQLISQHTAQPFRLLPADYLLGILDLPGELMRFATNNLSTSLTQLTSLSLFLHALHRSVCGLTLRPWAAYSGKLTVLMECLEKIEKLGYRLEMREAVDAEVMSRLEAEWGQGIDRKRDALDDDRGGEGEDGGGGGKRMKLDEQIDTGMAF